MDHKHCHDECEHEKLKYCKKCDVVYCESCGKEWPAVKWHWTYPITTSAVHEKYNDDGTISFHCH